MEANDTASGPMHAHALSILRSRWEEGLLLAVIVALVGMTLYLLWPQPLAEVTLTPLDASAGGAVSSGVDVPQDTPTTDTATVAASDESASAAKPAQHHEGHRKPDKPPVTSINAASAEQLQLLPGIGPKMAERVIDYRKQNGAFKTVDEIMQVKGIGAKKFAKMQPFLKL